MRLLKLAAKNVKTQAQHYVMYVIGMAFVVLVYYSFLSIRFDAKLLSKVGQSGSIASGLQSGTVMISLFMLVFMLSANQLFVKRRKQEIGLYHLMGMRRRHIGFLFFIENMLLGLISLVIGLFFGLILSKLFAMLLMKAIYAPVETGLVFSIQGIRQTISFFMILLLFVSLRTGTIVYRYRLVDLFRATELSESPHRIRPFSIILGCLGVALIGTGYYLASHFSEFLEMTQQRYQIAEFSLITNPLFILGLCVLGTYLIFYHFFPVVLFMIQRNKRHYYKDINMVTTGNLGFQMRRNAKTFATIAVLAGTALAAIGGAATLKSQILFLADATDPATFAVKDDSYQSLVTFLEEKKEPIDEDKELHFKYVGAKISVKTQSETLETSSFHSVMPISDYNDLANTFSHVQPIDLRGEKDVAILGGYRYVLENDQESYGKEALLGNIGAVSIVANQPDFIGNGPDFRIGEQTLVVSDSLFADLVSEYTYSYHLINVLDGDKNQALAEAVEKQFGHLKDITTYVSGETKEVQGKMVDMVEVLDSTQGADLPMDSPGLYTQRDLSIRYPYYASLRSSMGLLIYVATFLGVVFMIATGSIIMLNQLSDAEDDIPRYELLRKLGTPPEMIRRSVYRQNIVVFFIPLLVSIGHAYFALDIVHFLFKNSNVVSTYKAVLLLIFIYSLFYLGTSSAYNRMVNDER